MNYSKTLFLFLSCLVFDATHLFAAPKEPCDLKVPEKISKTDLFYRDYDRSQWSVVSAVSDLYRQCLDAISKNIREKYPSGLPENITIFCDPTSLKLNGYALTSYSKSDNFHSYRNILSYNIVTETKLKSEHRRIYACERLLDCKITLASLNPKAFGLKDFDEYRSNLRKSIADLQCE